MINIQLLLTGHELMTGDTVDSNSAEIAQQLLPLGAQISRKITVGDHLDILVNSLATLTQSADILIVNGGLGPTEDDLTALALSKLVNAPLVEHPQALEHLRNWSQGRNYSLNKSNLKQTLLPAGADIIANACGSAVGIRLRHNNCDIFATPGVPSELRGMLKHAIIPEIETRIGTGERQLRQRYQVFGLGESTLQQWVNDELPDWSKDIELGFRAGAPMLEVKIQSPLSQHALHEIHCQQLETLLGDYIVGKGANTLAHYLIDHLKEKGKKLTTAESCTGGLIASMLTQVAGASAVFEAGFVTYANEIKSKVLGVSKSDLDTYGAVSETVVTQMAQGALETSGADYVIAVSGIAGPEGGNKEKPVGTVWIAWGNAKDLRTECLYFPYTRELFQTMVAGTGLDLIRRQLLNIETPARYLSDRRLPAEKQANQRTNDPTCNPKN